MLLLGVVILDVLLIYIVLSVIVAEIGVGWAFEMLAHLFCYEYFVVCGLIE